MMLRRIFLYLSLKCYKLLIIKKDSNIIMSKIKLISLCIFSLITLELFAAKQLNNFAEVQDAVLSGSSINLVTELGLCKTNSHVLDKDSFVSVKLDKIKLTQNKKLTASSLHYTLNNPRYKNKPVYEHMVYKVFADGYAVLTYSPILDNPSQQPEFITTIHCQLNNGIKLFETA